MSLGVNLWRFFNGGKSPEESVEAWLYGETDNGTWDKDDQALFDRLYGVPLVKDYLDYKLDMRNRYDYMKNTGINYGDTNDPRIWPGSGSSGRLLYGGLNFVSRNIERLYR